MLDEEHAAHAHGHGTGVRWLDLVVTISVVAISVISLVVSVNHGRTMESLVEANRKMVEASTYPYIEAGSVNLDPVNNRPMVGWVIDNAGVGPAVIDWVQVEYDGHPAATPGALLHACCKTSKGRVDGFMYSTPSGRVLPAKETIKAYWFAQPQQPEQRALFDRFAAAQSKITASACYCSILDQCWITHFDNARPAPVKACSRGNIVPYH